MVALKDFFASDFLLGAAFDGPIPERLNPAEQALFLQQFNTLTAENCLKPGRVQPEEGRFTFQDADTLADFARTHHLHMVGHTLLWHNNCPEWFFKDGEKQASRELVLQRLRAHIHAVVGRYKGTIAGWDVCNEVIADNEKYLRPSHWLETIGDDFVAQAFRFAHEADPNVLLHYNDYDNENPIKRDKTLRLLRSLREAGCRVDAVGLQGHFLLDKVPFGDVEDAIEIYAREGYQVMITELDLDVLPFVGPEAEITQPLSPEQLAPLLLRQAEQYAKLFSLFRKHRDKITRVTFWNPHDGRSWRNNWPTKGRTNHPLLFDRELRPKPAFFAVTGSS